MADSLTLEVATPLGLALSAECTSVEAPSVAGQFGVLPNHLPLLAALKCGLLRYEVDGKEHVAAVGPGFVSAAPDKVELLTDLFARPEDIILDDVREELIAAEEELRKFPKLYEGPDYQEVQREVDWAHARIETAAEADK